jgi:hypothetical protein
MPALEVKYLSRGLTRTPHPPPANRLYSCFSRARDLSIASASLMGARRGGARHPLVTVKKETDQYIWLVTTCYLSLVVLPAGLS